MQKGNPYIYYVVEGTEGKAGPLKRIFDDNAAAVTEGAGKAKFLHPGGEMDDEALKLVERMGIVVKSGPHYHVPV